MLNVCTTIYSSQIHISVVPMSFVWKSGEGGLFIDTKFPNHYPQTYNTHGETMLTFQAMPFYKPDAFCLGSDTPWIVL